MILTTSVALCALLSLQKAQPVDTSRPQRSFRFVYEAAVPEVPAGAKQVRLTDVVIDMQRTHARRQRRKAINHDRRIDSKRSADTASAGTTLASLAIVDDIDILAGSELESCRRDRVIETHIAETYQRVIAEAVGELKLLEKTAFKMQHYFLKAAAAIFRCQQKLAFTFRFHLEAARQLRCR